MTVELITLYILLQIKHWYIDFAAQTKTELEHKGIYGSVRGMTHSIKHGIATLFCILAITGQAYFFYALIIAIIDAVTHYHIDWVKTNYGEKDMSSPKFWNHLGLDQMAHQIIYLFILTMVF